ncbi:ComEC/Rec2 family competence protein [Naasia lichenicola]|uniref:MBL fold metallo-hydrolase n=1 Tax=Naasia lichenicola TaxID=2565933 RepID=A0A4S4FHY3_9MICO|nr:ComEC/Rec2 family competence protein [Naasia lichenicola]THG28755.1 MBL fold metallo-hydrolase [Naasia lichenicola]
MIDLRLLPAALLCWLACGVLVGLPDAAPFAAATLIGAACGIAVVQARRGRATLSGGRRGSARLSVILTSAAVALALAGAALVSLAINDSSRSPAALEGRATSGVAIVEITGAAVEDLGAGSAGGIAARTRVRGLLTSIEVRDRLISARAPILLFGDGEAVAGHPIGSTVRMALSLRPADAGSDAAFLAFARGDVDVIEDPHPFVGWAGELRAGFTEAASLLPGDGGSLLPGLAIGDVSSLDPAVDDAMTVSSLSHLTAVSGANCAVVVAAIMLFGARIGVRRGLRIAAAGIALVGFVVLVTPQPSVLRAAVMALVVLVALASGRARAGLPTLCVAVIALLIADPWLSRSFGFALSTLATAGLLLLARPIALALGRWLPAPLALSVAVPLAAQLACQPVIVLLDPTLPLLSVPANLLAEPAAPVATLIGLVACLLLPVAPPLGELLMRIAWLPSAWIAAVARFFAAHPEGRLPWLTDLPGVLAMTVLAVLLARAFLRRRWRLTAGVLALAILVSAGVGIGTKLGGSGARPSDWEVASCDIGQGDASVVRSKGHFALIDTGDDPPALLSCLADLGAASIDLLVLTHFDLDHVGAATALVGRVDLVLHGPTDGPSAVHLLDRLEAGGAQVQEVSRGARGTLGAVGWRALWPPAGDIEPGNDASVVLRTDGTLRSIFLGDLGADAQRAVLRIGDLAPGAAGGVPMAAVDVVKVAHHGSSDQYPRLYDALRARVALISCGIDNDYGHPTGELLGILREDRAVVLRTDLEGELLVSANGDGMRTWTERAPDRDPTTSVGAAN